MFDLKAELLSCLREQDQMKSQSEKDKWLTFRGGNSGAMRNGHVITGNGTCLRKVLLRSKGIQEPKQLKTYLTFALGYGLEDVFGTLKNSKKMKFEEQVAIQGEIPGTSVRFSGTADYRMRFALADGTFYYLIADTKGCSSINTYFDSIVEGKVKGEYIAQIVSYMEYEGINHGQIVQTNFVYAKRPMFSDEMRTRFKRGEPTIEPDIHCHDVRIDGNHILVNGKLADFTMGEVRAHRFAGARTIEDAQDESFNAVHPHRPVKTSYFDPCNNCPFKRSCDAFDNLKDKSTSRFIELIKEHTEGL